MSVFVFLVIGILTGGLLSAQHYRLRVRRARTWADDLKRKLKNEVEILHKETDRQIKVINKESERISSLQSQHLARVIKRYSVGAELARLTFTITNLDGDCRITRFHKGLKANKGIQLKYMRHGFNFTTPGCKISEVTLIHSASTEGVKITPEPDSESRRSFNVVFPDSTASSEDGVSYAYQLEVQRGVTMTKEDADAAYASDVSQCEGYSYDSDIPTKSLEFEVSFPEHYPFKCSARAYVGGSWTLHQEQTSKLKLEPTDLGVRLLVKNPLHGFRYLIEWTAPTRIQLHEIKKKIVPATI